MPTTIASTDSKSRVYMAVKLPHANPPDQSSFNRARRTLALKYVSETSYIAPTGGTQAAGGGDRAALRKARSKARDGGQDARDAS